MKLTRLYTKQFSTLEQRLYFKLSGNPIKVQNLTNTLKTAARKPLTNQVGTNLNNQVQQASTRLSATNFQPQNLVSSNVKVTLVPPKPTIKEKLGNFFTNAKTNTVDKSKSVLSGIKNKYNNAVQSANDSMFGFYKVGGEFSPVTKTAKTLEIPNPNYKAPNKTNGNSRQRRKAAARSNFINQQPTINVSAETSGNLGKGIKDRAKDRLSGMVNNPWQSTNSRTSFFSEQEGMATTYTLKRKTFAIKGGYVNIANNINNRSGMLGNMFGAKNFQRAAMGVGKTGQALDGLGKAGEIAKGVGKAAGTTALALGGAVAGTYALGKGVVNKSSEQMED